MSPLLSPDVRAPGAEVAAPDATPASRELLVRQVTWEADGVVSLQLVDPDGRALESWEPGAHVDVVLPSGLVRQYSLCGDVDDRGSYRLAVLLERDSRGGSREIHESALVGRHVVVNGPRNRFRLVDAERYLFLAGGIGATPIVPMVRQAHRAGRPWRLVYGGRRRSSMAFLAELARYPEGRVAVLAEDEQGLPDLERILGQSAAGTAVYCCGPPGMISAVETAVARHLGADALHVERFTAPDDAASGTQAGDTGFEVELARSGRVLSVPADRSLLEVAREAAPSLLYSCEQGYCGTCELRVLEGEPDHRDTVLSDEERAEGKMMICVGRSKTPRLVLDA